MMTLIDFVTRSHNMLTLVLFPGVGRYRVRVACGDFDLVIACDARVPLVLGVSSDKISWTAKVKAASSTGYST